MELQQKKIHFRLRNSLFSRLLWPSHDQREERGGEGGRLTEEQTTGSKSGSQEEEEE